MYKRILVPLDGSKLAECALIHAEELAKGCSAGKIILVSVTEQVEGQTQAPEAWELYSTTDRPEFRAGPSEMTVIFGKKQRQAERYLGRVATKLEAKGITADIDVLIGDPAGKIVDYARNPGCDVIVMATHGRSGPSRWAFGSVADKVLRSSGIPVLLIRAPGCTPSA
jgi:nucleotide-binding universal stress UspA family protein